MAPTPTPSWLGESQTGRGATTQIRLGPPRRRTGRCPSPPTWGEEDFFPAPAPSPGTRPGGRDPLCVGSHPGEAAEASGQASRSRGPSSHGPCRAALHRLPSYSPSPLQTRRTADVRLLRQGKPSLCPAGWGRSHPDKEFDSSNPVVRQAVGREGAGSGWAGAYPSLASRWAGGAARNPPPTPEAPQAKRAVPSLAGRGGPGDTDRVRDPLDHDLETETQSAENQKSQTLRHSGEPRWRQKETLKISDRPGTRRQRKAQKHPERQMDEHFMPRGVASPVGKPRMKRLQTRLARAGCWAPLNLSIPGRLLGGSNS